MYPFGIDLAARIRVPGVSSVLEGAHRPGHFDGVCTVVARLFNQVQPDVAAFGKKDYQQLAVIQQMVRDLAFPIQILGGSIVRESDGLAMSSRNQYLGEAERPVASRIRQILLLMRDGIAAGKPRTEVEATACAQLAAAGYIVDYATVRRPDLSEPAEAEQGDKVALIAARLGKTRLIDNLEF